MKRILCYILGCHLVAAVHLYVGHSNWSTWLAASVVIAALGGRK